MSIKLQVVFLITVSIFHKLLAILLVCTLLTVLHDFVVYSLSLFHSPCSDDEEDELVLNVKCHFSQAQVISCIFNIGDCAYIKVSL